MLEMKEKIKRELSQLQGSQDGEESSEQDMEET
jgi:hypothetical protein